MSDVIRWRSALSLSGKLLTCYYFSSFFGKTPSLSFPNRIYRSFLVSSIGNVSKFNLVGLLLLFFPRLILIALCGLVVPLGSVWLQAVYDPSFSLIKKKSAVWGELPKDVFITMSTSFVFVLSSYNELGTMVPKLNWSRITELKLLQITDHSLSKLFFR